MIGEKMIIAESSSAQIRFSIHRLLDDARRTSDLLGYESIVGLSA